MLKGKDIPFARPFIGQAEKRAVLKVLDGPVLVHGPMAVAFEKAFMNYTGAPYAVAVSSCTAALHLTYFHLGICPGDEVIVPAQTHVATAHAVELCGAKPVFVDAEKSTGNMDLDLLERSLGPRTKAISIVHFLGMPINMVRVMQIAKKRGLFVVEDCALAVGSFFNNTHAGLHGDVGCFSFYPVKHITTAEGGMLITRHASLAAKIARQKAFGVDRSVSQRSVPGVYDVTMLGLNYLMNELQAALGIEQLKRVPEILRRRKENYNQLSRGLATIEELRQFKSSHGNYQSSYYCLSVMLDETLAEKRPEIINYFRRRGIGTSVYYPRPVPHFSYYTNKYRYSESSYPAASWISQNSIALPVGPHLNPRDMKSIVKCFKDAISEAVK